MNIGAGMVAPYFLVTLTMTASRIESPQQPKLLATLERLLAIQATSIRPALEEAADLIAAAVNADKADAFLHEPATQTLVALGTSSTPMGAHQRALGLDRLPIANAGRVVEVFQTGRVYLNGRVDEDMQEIRGIREALGVKSSLIVPLDVAGVRRGAVLVSRAQHDAFSPEDRVFLEAVARWVGLVIQRAELVERLTREATADARRLAAEELVTVMAHDIGNLLTPLVSRVFLLRRRAEREGRKREIEDADLLGRGLHRLERFITDLLDVARIEQGIFAIVRQPINLAELVREVATMVQTAHFHVAVEASEEVIAEVDPPRIRQALDNLLANARRHAPGSPVTVSVQQDSRDNRQWVVLGVQDRGPGIAPELLPQLTERFVRGKQAQGLGIGLYLARSIAEAHGGRLEVASAVGEGATFRLTLPAKAE